MLLYSTLLCKKIARAPGGHKRFMLTKLGGGGGGGGCRIDPKVFMPPPPPPLKGKQDNGDIEGAIMDNNSGLLGENKPISRRDQFSSTYALAFIDPDCRDYDKKNTDRAAGLSTMRVPAPPCDRRKMRGGGCCACCSWDDSRLGEKY